MSLVFYTLLFLAVGCCFLLINLLIGKLIRPDRPQEEKGTIYECGEPTIGSAWVQFDLRYYVVALLFVIFDVEVAFFFPWAVVFGNANAVAHQDAPPAAERRAEYNSRVRSLDPAAAAAGDAEITKAEVQQNSAAARKLSWIAFLDILVFFGVLLVGFAYLWRRGDLAWVRTVTHGQAARPPPPAATTNGAAAGAPVLTGTGSSLGPPV
jgi:NADH-quinone oxidoreductase subunit A